MYCIYVCICITHLYIIFKCLYIGSYKQLSCKLGEAEAQYKKSFAFDHSNIDVHLKLVMLLTEFGDLKEVCMYL